MRQDQVALVTTRLARFAETVGWPPEPGVLADARVIEAFCAHGLADATSTTRGTYRSVLRSWAGLADGRRARRGPGYPGAPAPMPYTPAQRAELCAIAAAQPTGRRDSALVLVAAGLGAGVSTGELMTLRGKNVRVGDDGGVVIEVSGRRPRRVSVTAPYATVLARAAARAGAGSLFRPAAAARGYKNAVCNFVDTLVADPAAPRFTLGRARSSFVCDHITTGTPVARLLAITGIAEAGSLARYAVHVPGAPDSKGAWRARLATEPAAQPERRERPR